jgi:ABC-type multidrug transport system ATPase subunit/ABC-type multidrug transport system permease subunit
LIVCPFQKREITALEDINISAKQGELFGLLGPNGAGKTTLIKLLCTLVLPTSGTAWVNGYNILSDESQVKASIGLVTSDERSFYWRLTGRQNLEFFATLYELSSEQAQKRINELAYILSLEHVLDNRFCTYSAGMKQRLAIMRSLLNDPDILFMDEPTKTLDPIAAHRLREFIKDKLVKERGRTVILATHHLMEAEQLCDRIAIIDKGKIKAYGTIKEVKAAIKRREKHLIKVRNLSQEDLSQICRLDENIRLSQISVEAGIVTFEIMYSSNETMLHEVFETIMNLGGRIEYCNSIESPLEEVFIQSTETDQAAIVESKPIAQTELHSQTNKRKISKWEWKKALAFLKKDFLIEISYMLAFFLGLFGDIVSISALYFLALLLGSVVMPHLRAYGGDYFSFILIGEAFYGYLKIGLSSFSQKIRGEQVIGTLEAMLVTPTKYSTIIISSAVWNFISHSVSVLTYLLIGVCLFDADFSNANVLVAVSTLALMNLAFSSLGIISASFIMIFKRGDPINFALGRISVLLGGVYYPITILPGWLQHLSYLLPIIYSLNAMRHALLQGNSLQTVIFDLIGLLVFTIIMLPLSLLIFRYAVKKARVNGSLTHY